MILKKKKSHFKEELTRSKVGQSKGIKIFSEDGAIQFAAFEFQL